MATPTGVPGPQDASRPSFHRFDTPDPAVTHDLLTLMQDKQTATGARPAPPVPLKRQAGALPAEDALKDPLATASAAQAMPKITEERFAPAEVEHAGFHSGRVYTRDIAYDSYPALGRVRSPEKDASPAPMEGGHYLQTNSQPGHHNLDDQGRRSFQAVAEDMGLGARQLGGPSAASQPADPEARTAASQLLDASESTALFGDMSAFDDAVNAPVSADDPNKTSGSIANTVEELRNRPAQELFGDAFPPSAFAAHGDPLFRSVQGPAGQPDIPPNIAQREFAGPPSFAAKHGDARASLSREVVQPAHFSKQHTSFTPKHPAQADTSGGAASASVPPQQVGAGAPAGESTVSPTEVIGFAGESSGSSGFDFFGISDSEDELARRAIASQQPQVASRQVETAPQTSMKPSPASELSASPAFSQFSPSVPQQSQHSTVLSRENLETIGTTPRSVHAFQGAGHPDSVRALSKNDPQAAEMAQVAAAHATGGAPQASSTGPQPLPQPDPNVGHSEPPGPQDANQTASGAPASQGATAPVLTSLLPPRHRDTRHKSRVLPVAGEEQLEEAQPDAAMPGRSP